MRHISPTVVLVDAPLEFVPRGSKARNGSEQTFRNGSASPSRNGDAAAAVFGPEDIVVMRNAFDRSWAALAFASWRDESDRRSTRERIARSILHKAASGERRVGQLTDHALGALEPRSA